MSALTPKQLARWKILIEDCKDRHQSNINVGGKAVREMLIAVDDILFPKNRPGDCEHDAGYGRCIVVGCNNNLWERDL